MRVGCFRPLGRIVMVMVLVLRVSGISHAEHRELEFARKIGVDGGGWMGFVAFSPDGRRVASDGPMKSDDQSGKLTLWSFSTGRSIRELSIQPSALSPDWKYYASYHGVGELTSGKPLISLPENVFANYAFSPDSRYVAEALSGNGIKVLELPSGKQVSTFGKHAIRSIAISPDGRTLASGQWSVVALWDMFTGKRLALLRGFGRYVDAVAFSKDGRYLAAGTDWGRLEIWDVRHRRRLYTVDLGGGLSPALAFSPNGRFVAIGLYGRGTVWLVDVANGKILDSQKVSDLGCGAVAFSPDSRFLITPSTGGLIKWPYDSGGTIRVFRVEGR